MNLFEHLTLDLVDLLNNDNPYFEGMIGRICLSKLQ